MRVEPDIVLMHAQVRSPQFDRGEGESLAGYDARGGSGERCCRWPCHRRRIVRMTVERARGKVAKLYPSLVNQS